MFSGLRGGLESGPGGTSPHLMPCSQAPPRSPDELGVLTQGSAIMSHRITRLLSRAPERGWQVAMC